MRKRIFYTLLFMTLSSLLITLSVSIAIIYRHFTGEQFQQLRNEIRLVTNGQKLGGQQYLQTLDTNDFRVTWITEEGKILFDNEADYANMENHLEREEIREALEAGHGESSRYSSTLEKQQLYVADSLDDGTILRLSITQAPVWKILLENALPLLGVAFVLAVASYVLASRLSLRIVTPINELDLDDPMSSADSAAYAEIQPLLNRLSKQYIQIQADRDELEKTSLIRQEFTANASHELKTPLHVISGYAELLENGMAGEEEIPIFASKIRSESQRMIKLVEDIIDLSNLDGGAVGVKREMTDLCRVAQNAVESLTTAAQEKDIRILFRGENAEVYGIPAVLYSIVYNLCDNAVKYSEPGKKIEVNIYNVPEGVVLSVADEGIGIPEDELDRIFERFYRVDKSRSKEVGGTGLGLSIVKHATIIHNAMIGVKSEPGKGSVFTITFLQ